LSPYFTTSNAPTLCEEGEREPDLGEVRQEAAELLASDKELPDSDRTGKFSFLEYEYSCGVTGLLGNSGVSSLLLWK
jgi:hypothetical protein